MTDQITAGCVVVGLTVRRGKIVEIDVIADPDRLRHLDLGVLNG